MKEATLGRMETMDDPFCERLFGSDGELVRAVNDYARDYRLSGQETLLLLCAARGVSDKCAAATLSCTRSTVGTYWQRIYRKVGQQGQCKVLAHLLRRLIAAPPSGHSLLWTKIG